ncbi:uncharacterized protein LOC126668374 [Mercurialis annua]|uniref:uncharacterized protein LOC126668374 n=1 Tax=Mercurialis annua TaxID=3986 RepID=UPI00215E91BD|nr:uncharacterized protein LOC126668374 [Mercurialis annua]
MDEQRTPKDREEHLEEKVRQVMSRLGIRCEDVDISLQSDSPLADFIISHEFPAKFKYTPNLESYDRTGCPKSHLFPTTLKGLAQEWYQSLKPGSVLTFKQFSGLFQARFVACIPQKKLSTDLLSIMQRDGETLRKYVERFNKEAMQIEDLSQEIAYTSLLNGTTNSDMRKELLAKSPRLFTTLMTIAHTQIRVDDGQREIESRHGGRVEERSFSEKRNEDRSPNGRRFGEKGNDRFRNKRKTDEDRRYTPHKHYQNQRIILGERQPGESQMAKENECCISQQKRQQVLQIPQRQRPHHIKFWHLKEEIEKESLSQFVKRDTEAKEAEVERKKERKEETTRRPRPEPASVVNVIMGGYTGGDSNTTRKKAARTVYSVSPGAPDIKKFGSVSFSEGGSHGLSLPHEDALLVKGRLNNFEVSRMLVDTGSSVNMITMKV